MANSPRDGQQFVGFKLDEKLLGLVDRARGYLDRSLFFRQAVAEKLKSEGIEVGDDLIFPPPRAGAHRHGVVMEKPGASPRPPNKTEVVYQAKKRGKKKS